ncbi:LysR family transcriptional regulator [Bacillus sp. B190/17]|uniref:LysR family transcriptional regulator n=1 Tax=Bacillus lumedeiriae TaxID=3058829 RepID=A0ABW8IC50_9BACI
MELRNLRTFMVVSEQLNLSKAAQQLGYTQPTVTIQIKALEEELGHTLISRSGNHTFLTPAGKLLQQHGERIFSQLQEMREDLNKLSEFCGSLMIAGPEFYCTHYLHVILKAYFQQYPQVNIKLVSCHSAEAIKMVHSGEADIGIIAGECHLSGVESVIIESEDILLTASAELVKEKGAASVLENFPILLDKNQEPLSKKLFEEIDYSPASVIECSSEETIKRFVLNQMGVCILGSATIEEEINTGKLTVLHRFSKGLNTSLIYRKHREKEHPIQTFSELVKENWAPIRKQRSSE